MIVDGAVAYVPLTRNGVAVIDAGLAAAVEARGGWSWDRKDYARRHEHAQVDGRTKSVCLFLHTFVWALAHGGVVVKGLDHRNRNKLDCRVANLRRATNAQNTMNIGLPRSNTSGVKGVRRSGEKWIAFLGGNGATKYLGTFPTREAAAQARDAAARRAYGEYAWTNSLPSSEPS